MATTGKVFSGIEELIAQEERENQGIEVAWPAVKGARVTIAHAGLIGTKAAALEAEYRASLGLKTDDPLPLHDPILAPAKVAKGQEVVTVEEAILRKAIWQTTVLGWRIPTGDGGWLPVDEETFNKLISQRRFRRFVLETSANLETARATTLEDEEKN